RSGHDCGTCAARRDGAARRAFAAGRRDGRVRRGTGHVRWARVIPPQGSGGERAVSGRRGANPLGTATGRARGRTRLDLPGGKLKMIKRVVDLALRNRVMVAALVAILFLGGLAAYRRLDVEAYPNPVPPLVEVISQPPGWSAEET